MEKKKSIVHSLDLLWGDIFDVNPVSAILFTFILLPLVIISAPVDLIRVILSKLTKK